LFIQKSVKDEKAEKSGTAEKEREKAEIFRKKRKRWQPCILLANEPISFVDTTIFNPMVNH
jgi:hypothetical protein